MSDNEAEERELVGIRECARRLEVDPSTISRNVSAGIIRNHGTDEAPLVNVEEARRDREAFLDPTKRGNHAGRLAGEDAAEDPGEPGEAEGEGRSAALRDAKTEIAQHQAALAKLQLEERQG